MMKTRGKLSKALVLCLTLLMAIGMFGTTAFAAVTPNQTGTITVENVEDGVAVSAYRLMDVKVDATSGQPQEPVYTWVTEVANWVRTNYSAYIGGENDNSVQAAFSTATAEDIAAFYDALAAAIRATTDPLNITAAGTREGSGDIENLTMGNYLILIENGYQVYRPSAVNLVPVWNDTEWNLSDATVQVKSSEIDIKKTVKAEGTQEGLAADNASIGDTVTFEIVADIPQFPANALAKNYAISDTLPTGLTFNGNNSLKVYGVAAEGTETELKNGTTTYYTQSTSRPEGTGQTGTTSFTLAFNYETIKSYTKIHIEYTATLNSDAALGESGNVNTAVLDYSNNPYVATSWKSKDDSATVYTYGLDISKVDGEDNSPLSGAEFELYATRDDANNKTNPISFVAENEAQGTYRVATNADLTTITTLKVGTAEGYVGKLTIKGLDEQAWYLVETKAPGGYNLLAEPKEVTITDLDESVLDGKVANAKGNSGEDAALAVWKVENDNGFQLPVTGGMGTILFTAVGVVLMGAAAILLIVVLKRKKAQD